MAESLIRPPKYRRTSYLMTQAPVITLPMRMKLKGISIEAPLLILDEKKQKLRRKVSQLVTTNWRRGDNPPLESSDAAGSRESLNTPEESSSKTINGGRCQLVKLVRQQSSKKKLSAVVHPGLMPLHSDIQADHYQRIHSIHPVVLLGILSWKSRAQHRLAVRHMDFVEKRLQQRFLVGDNAQKKTDYTGGLGNCENNNRNSGGQGLTREDFFFLTEKFATRDDLENMKMDLQQIKGFLSNILKKLD